MRDQLLLSESGKGIFECKDAKNNPYPEKIAPQLGEETVSGWARPSVRLETNLSGHVVVSEAAVVIVIVTEKKWDILDYDITTTTTIITRNG